MQSAMSVRRRLILLLAVAVASGTLSIGMDHLSANNAREADEASRVHHADLARHLTLIIHAEQYLRVAETPSGSSDAEPGALADARTRVEQDLDALRSLRDTLDQEPDEAGTESGEDERFSRIRSAFDALKAGVERARQPGADHAVEMRRVKNEFQRGLLREVSEAVDDEREDLEKMLDANQSRTRTLRAVRLALSVAAFLMLATLVWLLTRFISHSLQLLRSAAARMTAGDLSTRVETGGGEEFDELAGAFNAMAQGLKTAQDQAVKSGRLAVLGQMAASVSHELRNPLAAIRNANHYLRKRTKQTELAQDTKVQRFFDIIDREVGASTKIIGDLLDYARPRSPVLTAVALGPLVDEALSIVKLDREVRLENQTSSDLPLVRVDEQLLRQVLVNLAQNGAEAIPEDREGRVTVRAEVDENHLVFRVGDNGCGMDEATRTSVFEPLFTTKVKGTGLGLAICASIAERLGGNLGVESTNEEGTTFRLVLPREDAPALEAAE
ncbi:MAG: ATP-binding protein [Polyangiaceae bacterium]